MEQNKYQGRQELPSKVTGTIDRILEEMRIEGISVLEFPEQFLAVLLIEIVCKLRENRWRENPFLYEEGGRKQCGRLMKFVIMPVKIQVLVRYWMEFC